MKTPENVLKVAAVRSKASAAVPTLGSSTMLLSPASIVKPERVTKVFSSPA